MLSRAITGFPAFRSSIPSHGLLSELQQVILLKCQVRSCRSSLQNCPKPPISRRVEAKILQWLRSPPRSGPMAASPTALTTWAVLVPSLFPALVRLCCPLESSSLKCTCVVYSLASLRSLLKCQLLGEALSDHPTPGLDSPLLLSYPLEHLSPFNSLFCSSQHPLHSIPQNISFNSKGICICVVYLCLPGTQNNVCHMNAL